MKIFKNKELKYKFEKNKGKIFTIISIIIAFIVLSIVGVQIYVNRPIESPPNEEIPDEIIREADYIINGTDNGDISLISVKGNKVINDLNLAGNTLYAKSNDLDYIMAFTNNTFYKISMDTEVLKKEEISKININDINISSFKFSDKYIVAIKDDIIYTISLNDKNVSTKNIKDIKNYIVYKNYLIYTINDSIYSLNLDTNNIKDIYIGDKTNELFVMNDKIVAFNDFGSGNKSNIIVRFNPDDLYLEREYTHSNNNISALTPDSDDFIIPFIDNINKNNIIINTHYRINIDKDGGNKRQISLPSVQDDSEYTEYNSFSSKGYMYSTKNNELEITSFESQEVVETINDYKVGFFMPILD